MQSSELGSESSGSSEGSDDDASGYTRGRVDMNLQYLQSFHAVASNKKKVKSKYAANGCSKTRVKEALEKPLCNCRCKMPLQVLLRVCMAFWLLTKSAQDTVLWNIQQSNPGSGSKRDWFIEGLHWHCLLYDGAVVSRPQRLFFCNSVNIQDTRCAKWHGCNSWLLDKNDLLVVAGLSMEKTDDLPLVESCPIT